MQPVANAEDAAFLADLLGDVDTNLPSRLPSKTVKTAGRRKTRVLSPPISQSRKITSTRSKETEYASRVLNTPPLEPLYDDDMTYAGGLDDGDFLMNDEMPSSPISKAVQRKTHSLLKNEDEEEDDIMEVTQAIGDHNVKSASVNISGSRPAPKIKKDPPYPSPESSSPTRPPSDTVDPSAWSQVTSKLNVVSSEAPETRTYGKLQLEEAIEEDGSVRMFWTDYTEVNGSLCLFGKVKDRKTGFYVSAFVKVDNVLRKLYFLPRTHRQRKLQCQDTRLRH